MKPQYNILDHLTEKVLSKEMSLEVACFKFLTHPKNQDIKWEYIDTEPPKGYYESLGREEDYLPSYGTGPAVLVTAFEVLHLSAII